MIFNIIIHSKNNFSCNNDMTGAGYTVAAAAAGGYSEVLRSSAVRLGAGAGLLGVVVALVVI